MAPEATRRLWVAVIALAGVSLPARAAPPIDAREARRAFEDFARVCRADAGRLWGESLCGPLLLVDPATRAFVANQAPAQSQAAHKAGLYEGVLPPEQLVANTALQWAGTTWAQLRWPLPGDATVRRVLLVHESFHRVQERLGLAAKDSGNAHLDSLEGRVLLQLEWRALKAALVSRDAARRQAVEDALVFRAARRSQFPGSAEQEDALERHEGLAEYTGIRLAASSPQARRALAVKNLEAGPGQASFVRGFAYASVPAYGLLLDETGDGWRARLREGPADLGELLGAALSLEVPASPSPVNVSARAERYGHAALRQEEEEREATLRRRVAEYRRKLVEGPVLRLPLQRMKIEFNPNTLVPLAEAGTVYPTGRIVDAWGILSITGGGVLVDGDWKRAQVAAPAAAEALSGEGWSLQLAPGWRAVPGERQGDLELREER